MQLLYFVLLLLAGVCFGLAAGNVTTRKLNPVNFLAIGLLLWVAVEGLRTLQHLG